MIGEDLRLVIAMPVYNDWEVAACCLQQLNLECIKTGLRPVVLLINDGSTAPVPEEFLAWRPETFVGLEILDLYKNLGHQRAICVAMVHVSQNHSGAAVLVMDADGEDPPEQVHSLVRAYLENGRQRAIFAARRRRTEGLLFKTFYQIFRLIHLLLVGFDIRIGNFSIVPPSLVARLVRSSDLWNHYAASVVKSKLPYGTIPIDRGRRLKGESKMSFAGLILHGLSAMSVYSDVIGVRILMFTGVLMGLGLLVLGSVVVIRFATDWAIPGWATNLFALTLLLMFQVATACLLFTFGVLASRSGPSFIPSRDCPFLVMNVRRLGLDRV
jgi:hypothetical protein